MSEPWVDVYSGDDDELPDHGFGITWHFGPQGHPASMRIVVSMFDEHGMAPELWLMCAEPDGYNGPLRSSEQVAKAIEYGRKIDAEFGRDHAWHQCSAGCSGFQCKACDGIGVAAKARAAEWRRANPLPDVRPDDISDAEHARTGELSFLYGDLATVDGILAGIPDSSVIERAGFESRRDDIVAEIRRLLDQP